MNIHIDQAENYVIPGELLVTVIGYLLGRPYGEVGAIVPELASLPKETVAPDYEPDQQTGNENEPPVVL